MSAPSYILAADPEAKILSDIELAIRAGAAKALKARAAVQRLRAADGTSSAGEKYPRRHDPNGRGCRCSASGGHFRADRR